MRDVPPKIEQARFLLEYGNRHADPETSARWHGATPEALAAGIPDLVLYAAYMEAKRKDALRSLGANPKT